MVLIPLLILLVHFEGYSQGEKLKTVFIYNFTKYIKWPEEFKNDQFEIGVVGDSKITDELEELAKVKKVGKQSIRVKKISSINEGTNYHILIISEGASDQLDEIRKKLQNQPTLIIAEKEGLAKKGAGVNFLQENGRLLFEINSLNIESRSLKVSSQLLSLGKQVR